MPTRRGEQVQDEVKTCHHAEGEALRNKFNPPAGLQVLKPYLCGLAILF